MFCGYVSECLYDRQKLMFFVSSSHGKQEHDHFTIPFVKKLKKSKQAVSLLQTPKVGVSNEQTE